jgi:hypothetical protein
MAEFDFSPVPTSILCPAKGKSYVVVLIPLRRRVGKGGRGGLAFITALTRRAHGHDSRRVRPWVGTHAQGAETLWSVLNP